MRIVMLISNKLKIISEQFLSSKRKYNTSYLTKNNHFKFKNQYFRLQTPIKLTILKHIFFRLNLRFKINSYQ